MTTLGTKTGPATIGRVGGQIAARARDLAHLTLPHRITETLPEPSGLSTLLGDLRATSRSLLQVARQLSAHAASLSVDPRISTDGMGDTRSASAIASEIHERMAHAASLYEHLSAELTCAHNAAARLKLAEAVAA